MQKGLFIVLLVLAGHAWGQGNKPRILFLINEKAVYTDEFIYLYKKNHLKPEDFTDQKINEYLDLFTNFKLKVMEAKARGLDTTEAFRKEFRTYREELKKPYVAEKDELDRLTKEAYQRLKEEIKASHILITIKPDATPADTLIAYNKIVATHGRILGGEDFEKVAREVSEEASAKSNGGNLGYFTALQMVYPFEQAAYKLTVGEISKPIRTRFGYHLVKVTDRKPARGEVEVSHIILRTGTSDGAKVKNKILEIYDQLQGGRSWEELCKEYTEDPATKDTGGRLRPFGVGALAGLPEFEAVAFSLKEPGEISDPFHSAYGWHIVRLEKKIPVPSFNEVEPALKRKVARDERLQIANRKLMEAKKIQFGFLGNNEVMTQIMSFADSNLLKGKWKWKGDDLVETKTIFSLQHHNYKVSEFISFIEKNQSVSAASPTTAMTQLYDHFLEEKLAEVEEAKLLAENPDFGKLLTEYKEGILLFTIMEKEVWNRAPEDTLGLRKYYNENKEKYKAGDRVRAKVLATTNKNLLDEVKKKVAAGDSIKSSDLKKFGSIQPTRNYERGESKAVDRSPWTIGLHSVDVDETHYLVEIENLVPPGTKSFDEARAQIVSDYQEMLEKKWVAHLKQKYSVKINNKGKKFVLKELNKK